jgi:L-lactate dehydrogenase complex protein LldG
MFEQFKARAEAVSAEVHRFASKTETIAFLEQFLRSEGIGGASPERAVWADRAFLDEETRRRLCERLPGLSFRVTRESAAEARIGISRMDWAVAETGTLLVDATAIEDRLVSSLPLIHIALVATGRILPDMASALGKFDPARSRYLSAITGPSRTADIERVLTIGVHGPKRLIVVFVDGGEEP